MSFHPSILDNKEKFTAYFTRSEPFNRVRALKNEAPVSHVFGCARRTWVIIKAPFAALLSLFFKAIAWVLNLFCMPTLANRCKVLAYQLNREINQLKALDAYGKRLLVHAYNKPQMTSTDTYGRGPIPVSSIASEEVKGAHNSGVITKDGLKNAIKNFFTKIGVNGNRKVVEELFRKGEAIEYLKREYGQKPKFEKAIVYFRYLNDQADYRRGKYDINTVYFYNPPGGCRGASEWFASLYLHTKDDFTDPLQHMIAVAKQFTGGYSSESAILQIFSEAQSLIGTKAEKTKVAQTLYAHELAKEPAETAKKVDALKAGIYCVGLPTHRVVYLKLDDQRRYLWDINKGLINVGQGELLDELEEYQIPGYHKNQIYFEEMTLVSSDIN